MRSRADLALHLPLRYEDETVCHAPEHAPAGEAVLVEAPLEAVEVAWRGRRQLLVRARGLVLRYFHFREGQRAAFARALAQGLSVRAYGELRRSWAGAEMIHPRVRFVRPGEPLAAHLTPVYPAGAGLAQARLRTWVAQALADDPLEETLPGALRARWALPGFAESVRLLHAPPPSARAALEARTHPAWRRVRFDELLAHQLAMRLAYRARRAERALALPADGPLLRRFLARLPFRLTRAQRRAMAEILADLAAPHPMQRLLLGDVGSGKTILAAIACLAAADAGAQAAVMAPTELLAEQHARKFEEWLAPRGVPVAWLHGALAPAERRRRLRAVASGQAPIVVGTHALFQAQVQFARLALAVVDEQHRFGVRERLALRAKSGADFVPHQLMMSATPIPRTLAMTLCADLDVSVLDELPRGRRPVVTKLVSTQRRAEVLERIRALCAAGERAYWVCPVIEDASEEIAAARRTHEALRRELAGIAVGWVHGRMAPEERARAMADFAAGRTQLLVATSVIEVGVDVPEATLMVIEHAERFGLAQLHQMRGRIGRGARESVCILLYAPPLSAAARERLKTVYGCADGFEIARRDLQLRGPGEVLGERQSGLPLMRYADPVRDEELARAAHEAADELLAADAAAARRHVARWLPGRAPLTGA